MNGIIVYEKESAKLNKNYINWYIDKFRKKGIELELVFNEEIDYSKNYDFAIVRVIAPKITKKLQDNGIRCFNNYKVSYITNDKALCYKYVSENGIEIMPTYYGISEVDTYPVVIKPKNSHGGDRVCMASNLDELNRLMPNYDNHNYVIQQVANNTGKDVRVYIIGNKIIAAMLRESKNDFRSNFCLGGSAKVYNLSDSEIKLVNDVIKLFNFDFVGIDFVFNNGKMVFNEIEDVVGSRMIYSCTDIDIVDIYVNHIIKEVKNLS